MKRHAKRGRVRAAHGGHAEARGELRLQGRQIRRRQLRRRARARAAPGGRFGPCGAAGGGLLLVQKRLDAVGIVRRLRVGRGLELGATLGLRFGGLAGGSLAHFLALGFLAFGFLAFGLALLRGGLVRRCFSRGLGFRGLGLGSLGPCGFDLGGFGLLGFRLRRVGFGRRGALGAARRHDAAVEQRDLPFLGLRFRFRLRFCFGLRFRLGRGRRRRAGFHGRGGALRRFRHGHVEGGVAHVDGRFGARAGLDGR